MIYFGLILLTIVCIVEYIYSPRLDKADGNLILWYGKKVRKHINIY